MAQNMPNFPYTLNYNRFAVNFKTKQKQIYKFLHRMKYAYFFNHHSLPKY